MLLAGQPRLPGLLLALSPGLHTVLLGSGQVWAHVLVGVEQKVLQPHMPQSAAMWLNTDATTLMSLPVATLDESQRQDV